MTIYSFPPLKIEVLYSCPLCGLVKEPVLVPARTNEDLLEWMDQLILLLSEDHYSKRPRCHPTKLVDIRIPYTTADRVGGPPVQ